MTNETYTIRDVPLPDIDEDEFIAVMGTVDNVVAISSAKKARADLTPDTSSKDIDEVDPVDLFGQFPTPELPAALLPNVIRDFTEISARQIGCDPSGLAMAALTVCAAAIPDQLKVRVQAHNDKWKESARLWTLMIGQPSSKKTPTLNAASEILREIDREVFLDWQAEKRAYNALPKEERRGPPPPLRRLVIEDTTVEAAQGILAGSPWGVCVLQDEFAGFLGAMEKYGGSGSAHDRTVYLRCYNGGPYVINRKKTEDDGGVFVPNLSASMLGGVQPDVIKRLVEQSADDGLIQRFMPVVLGAATVGEDAPMPDVTGPFEDLVRALHEMKGDLTLQFDDEAQRIVAEVQAHHNRLQTIELVYKQLSTHIGKYDGLFARLCLLWHCIEHPNIEDLPSRITAATAQRVRSFLHGFLLKHAFAFYAGTLDSPDGHDRLRALAAYILAHRKTELKNRDVQSSVRSFRGLKDRDIRPLFEQLAALGWLTRVDGMRAGSPPHWRVTPRVHTLFAEKAEEEIRRREEVRAIIAEASVARREEQALDRC